MAEPRPAANLDRMTTRLPHLLVALAALYLTGIVLALSGDLASLGGAIALRANGKARIIGTVLLLAACTLSLAAVALDGDLGSQGLSAGQVAYQLLIAAATAATWVLAVRRLRAR